MTEQQKKFLQLAVIEGKKYDEIQDILGISRKEFAPWWNELKIEREAMANIRDKWKLKCPEIEFEAFRNWYTKASKNCYYCNISEYQIEKLWEIYPQLTKRNRGKSLEIERLKPNEKYSEINNLVFSCYWCNNAKTDTFTKDEFKKIGKVIQSIWQERLK